MLNAIKRFSYILITFLYLLTAGIIPLSFIYIEFNRDGLWWDYSRFYSHLFYYPLVFGGFSVYFSLRPITFFLCLPKRYRFNCSKRNLLILTLVAALVISLIEILPLKFCAIWEIAPNALYSHPQAQKVINHFKNPPSDPDEKFYSNNPVGFELDKEKIKDKRKFFISVLNQLIKHTSNWSYTRWAYFVSFYVQTLALLTLFWFISLFAIPRFRYLLENDLMSPLSRSAENNVESFKKNLIHLSVALIMGLYWLLMRSGFESDKMKVYGVINSALLVIGFPYLLSVFFVAISLVYLFRETVQGAITVISTLLSIGVAFQIWKTGSNFLGSDAQIQDYFMCFAAVCFILLPWILAYRDTFTNP